jgi:hypothetical protein
MARFVPKNQTQALNDARYINVSGDTMTGALSIDLATGNSLVVDTTTLVVDATNNRVGIGTASPAQTLQVVGEGAFTGTTAQATNPVGLLVFGGTNGGTVFARGNASGGDDHLNLIAFDDIVFRTLPASVNTVQMTLKQNGNLGLGTATFGTSAAKVLAIFNGTAPSTGPVDTVQLYSSDDAAGHTVPSFFCEGTNVLATGQADSVSSVRVKMRINGTVVTLLAI